MIRSFSLQKLAFRREEAKPPRRKRLRGLSFLLFPQESSFFRSIPLSLKYLKATILHIHHYKKNLHEGWYNFIREGFFIILSIDHERLRQASTHLLSLFRTRGLVLSSPCFHFPLSLLRNTPPHGHPGRSLEYF